LDDQRTYYSQVSLDAERTSLHKTIHYEGKKKVQGGGREDLADLISFKRRLWLSRMRRSLQEVAARKRQRRPVGEE